MKKIIISLFLALVVYSSIAQTPDSSAWTLEKCIEYAKVNNITIKKQKLNTLRNQNNYEQSKLNILPNFNAYTGYKYGFGRYFDEVSNEYVDRGQRLYGGINSETTLFQGFVKLNNIKEESQNYLASQQLVKETENNISLLIASYYLQILFDKELLTVAKEQYELTKQQVDRTQKLVDVGSSAMGSLLEIKAQLSREALNITNQENNLNISLLNLEQLLDIEADSEFDIVTPILPEIALIENDNSSNLFNQAQTIMPQIKRSQYELEASKYQLKKIKGYQFPELSFGAGWDTQASKIGSAPFDLKNNIGDNAYTTLDLTLSIPIFNGHQVKTSIKNAQLGILDAQYNLQTEKLTLRKEIEQANADALAAQKKYASGKEAVTSYEESFSYSQKRFEVGLISSLEYNTAKNDYTKAQSDLLQAKYEYVLRCKILDFYKGIPITL